MKAILIKGVSMPEERGFVDIRIYGDGEVVIPCGGSAAKAKAEAVTVPDEMPFRAENKENNMNETIKTALRFYIQHLKKDISFLEEHGMDTGALPQYLADAENELKIFNDQ